MKNIVITLVVFHLTLSVSAQKTDRIKIDFNLEMYPKEMLSKERKFSLSYDLDYREKAEAMKLEQEAEIARMEKEREDYTKQSAGSKLLLKALGETKPVVTAPSTVIPTIFSEAEVAPKISIPGYNKDMNAKALVKVVFSEMTYTHDATASSVSATINAHITVVNDKGITVFSDFCPKAPTTKTSMKLTAEENTSSGVKKKYRSIENFALNSSLANINEFLKVNYGYNMLKDDRSFFDVIDKKQTYTEHHQAIECVKNAFLYVGMESKKESMKSKLKEAITLWEKSLTELDTANKDAKINKDIGAATYLNLAEASIWLNDFDKAFDYLINYKMMGEDYSRAYERINDFLQDYSARYSKYTQY
ncbi:MAG: hypothetical protein EBR30_27105 [Cytophagia bacterium]|nr:hypothetical protein [Cytophagia bacterium]